MVRVAAPGGTVAAYVWDYADGMALIRVFWDAAVQLDSAAAGLHEGTRFPVCNPVALRAAFDDIGLGDVAVGSLDLTAEFSDFDEYWQPFLGGQGPAPAYAVSLPEEARTRLRDLMRSRLSPDGGAFELGLRAWAVRGVKPGNA